MNPRSLPYEGNEIDLTSPLPYINERLLLFFIYRFQQSHISHASRRAVKKGLQMPSGYLVVPVVVYLSKSVLTVLILKGDEAPYGAASGT